MSDKRIAHDRDDLKIEVLLKEHEMLHQRILNRTNSRFAIVGYSLALVAFVSAESDLSRSWRIFVGVTVCLILAAIWYRFAQFIKLYAMRATEIEEKVNSILDDKLLLFETRRRGSLFDRLITLPE